MSISKKQSTRASTKTGSTTAPKPNESKPASIFGFPVAGSEYRHPCGKRFDLLVPEFLDAMAQIMAIGAEKYGPENWKTGLTGENGGINHAMQHLTEYMAGKPNEYDLQRRHMHLAQIAVNVMFEYFFAENRMQTEKALLAFPTLVSNTIQTWKENVCRPTSPKPPKNAPSKKHSTAAGTSKSPTSAKSAKRT